MQWLLTLTLYLREADVDQERSSDREMECPHGRSFNMAGKFITWARRNRHASTPKCIAQTFLITQSLAKATLSFRPRMHCYSIGCT